MQAHGLTSIAPAEVPTESKKQPRIPHQRGFTLIELLVVIAIIAILVALLLPAVQQVREAARKSQCQDHLHNIVIALHGYEGAHQRLPPAGFHNNDLSQATPAFGSGSDSTQWGPNWAILTLPFMEQSALHRTYDFNLRRARDGVNMEVVNKDVSVLKCPSDGGEKLPWANETARFARGNYAANCGRATAFSTGDFNATRERGPFSLARPYGAKVADLEDGSSNTIFVAEIIAADREGDIRGTWAYPTGSIISGGGPSSGSPRIYLTPNGNALDDSKRDRPGRCDADNTDRNLRCSGNTNRGFQTARSKHPGGVQVSMGDGVVRFITENVDLQPWLTILSQADGNPVGKL